MSAKSNGIGLMPVLGVVFIVLKLCHVISWPWIWVLAPFWTGLAMVLLFMGVIALFTGAAVVIAAFLS